jgi:hypothetical protein
MTSLHTQAKEATDQMRSKLEGGGKSRSGIAAELMYQLFEHGTVFTKRHVARFSADIYTRG